MNQNNKLTTEQIQKLIDEGYSGREIASQFKNSLT